MKFPRTTRPPGTVRAAALALAASVVLVAAQGTDSGSSAQRIGDRIRALQEQADRLAAQSRTLVGELQQLDVERQLRAAEAQQAEADRAAAERELQQTTQTLEQLEQQRQAELPGLEAQLVDIYKRGRGGYARLMFAGRGVRDFARAMRAVTALAAINARRLRDHRATLEAMRREQSALQQRSRDLQARVTRANEARVAADRAVAARTAMAARIDSRRDLTAQYVGELQVAYDQLQQQLAAGSTSPVAVPLSPFRGALEWPVAGTLTARFGQTTNRLGGSAVKNGVEIAAAEGTAVHAVHAGTVAFAGPFTGFGTLVILDHGATDFSLYGYLSSAGVGRGDAVEGGMEIGRVGSPPGGTPALYFELRIDGRSVDPVQWLKSRQ
jgi:septal ring factor EnvC (AmiA/AmiB activator)